MLAMVNSTMTTAWKHGRITVNPHWNRNTWRKNYAKKCWPWLIQVWLPHGSMDVTVNPHWNRNTWRNLIDCSTLRYSLSLIFPRLALAWFWLLDIFGKLCAICHFQKCTTAADCFWPNTCCLLNKRCSLKLLKYFTCYFQVGDLIIALLFCLSFEWIKVGIAWLTRLWKWKPRHSWTRSRF